MRCLLLVLVSIGLTYPVFASRSKAESWHCRGGLSKNIASLGVSIVPDRVIEGTGTWINETILKLGKTSVRFMTDDTSVSLSLFFDDSAYRPVFAYVPAGSAFIQLVATNVENRATIGVTCKKK